MHSCWAPAYWFQRALVTPACRCSALEVAAQPDYETMTTADHCELRQKERININAQTKQREERRWNPPRRKPVTVSKCNFSVWKPPIIIWRKTVATCVSIVFHSHKSAFMALFLYRWLQACTYKGGIPRRPCVIEVSLLILCVVFPGEMKATAVTLGRVLPTLLNLTFAPFEFNHLLCSSQTGNHVEIHPTPNKCKYPQAVTHTCTVCLILTGMHPYVLRQLLQVEMPHGQILCHHSCTGCLNGGCYSQWPNSQWLRSLRLVPWSNFKLNDVLQTHECAAVAQ